MKKAEENKVRIKDIAARAGVSEGTVDRVLHNRGEVAAGTRNQVLAIVNEMAYTPNLLAKSLASKKLYTIAALLPDAGTDNPYWEKPQIGIRQAAEEIKDFNTRVVVRNFDLNSERSYLKNFELLLKENPAGLIFTPVFYSASQKILRICEEKNIPYIFIDMKLDSCNNLSYFGQNAEQSGFLAAKLMHFSIPEHSTVLIIKPLSKEGVNHHLQRREQGFLSFMKSGANTKKILTCSMNTDLSSKISLHKGIDKLLGSDSSVRGFFIINSRAFKVAQYLSEKKKKNILLIGYDLIAENLDFLERGGIDFLIGQKPEEQGHKSVQAMFNHLISGKPIDKTNYSPIDIILKENIDYYKNYKF
jgi:LacI family transcriptional regulator